MCVYVYMKMEHPVAFMECYRAVLFCCLQHPILQTTICRTMVCSNSTRGVKYFPVIKLFISCVEGWWLYLGAYLRLKYCSHRSTCGLLAPKKKLECRSKTGTVCVTISINAKLIMQMLRSVIHMKL